MTQPDFEQAREYVLNRLEGELPPYLFYHSLSHTRDDVLPAAERLGILEGVDGETLLLIKTAALYHDLGHIERQPGHEVVSIRIAWETLPHFGYSALHLELITSLILATRWPHNPQTPLEEILADADLDSLGREDFLETSLNLHAELAAQGVRIEYAEWYKRQLGFLKRHHYFTQSAHLLRDEGKERNIVLVEKLLVEKYQAS